MLIRVFAVILSFALSLQLALAGAGVTCVGPSGADSVAPTRGIASGMSDMDMTGPMEQHVGTRPESSAQRTPASKGVPCERSQASANCQLFASCAAGFVAAGTYAEDAVQSTSSDVGVIALLAPATRTIVPELPPPRA